MNQLIRKDDLYIKFKKITSIKIRDLEIKKYDVYEYVIIFIYILNNDNKITLIRREIHIINDLFIKTFIKIDIIKFKNIIFDINKNFVIIKLYNSLQVLMFIIIINFRINVVIFNKTRFVIFFYFFIIIFIKKIDLSINRDFILLLK